MLGEISIKTTGAIQFAPLFKIRVYNDTGKYSALAWIQNHGSMILASGDAIEA